MYKYSFFILLFFRLELSVQAQWAVEFEQDIAVSQENQNLKFPWAGGLNSGQYYNIDLNLDGQQDLIIFDRTSDQFIPFLSQNQQFIYAPEYSFSFPENISSWVVFADYDGDGRQDLFTASGKRSITVYRNNSNEQLSWELVADPLATIGFSGFEVAIQINPSDIPAISDIDRDGDLDIITYNVNGRGNLEYYQNQSVENNNKNLLEFEAKDDSWGQVRECGCGQFAFEGQNCRPNNNRTNKNSKQLHVGGKTLLAIDVDGDGDKDILSSDEGCGVLYFLENVGNQEAAHFTSFSTNYPEEFPEELSMSFPAAYYLDATHDRLKDLIIAPNVSGETVGSEDMRNSSLLYENVGTAQLPEFVLRQRNFLQAEMIDVGENAAPTLADYDADGDLDLFIAHRGSVHEDGYYGGIYLYENTGSNTEPSYAYITSDFLGLSQWKLQQLHIYFEDINGDGLPDLLVSGAENAFSSVANFYWLVNQASSGQMPWTFEPEQRQSLSLEFHPADQLEFIDANEDGSLDVFIATREGNLEYYQNQNNEGLPDWELVTENAGGISSSIFNRNLSVLLYDFEGDGEEDLLRCDASEVMLLYPDFLTQLEEEAIADTVLVSLGGQRNKLEMDKRVSLAAAEIDNSNKIYIFVGSPQGGVRLMSYSASSGGETSSLLVFPNPTPLSDPQVKVRSAYPIKWLQMISMNGAVLAEFEAENEVQEVTLDVAGVARGIYLIRVWDSQGKVRAGKLMVK
ncbi:T9SS type A sorting domain-containing protein [Catalinimonas sp. 4WD22]|uniref:T9SS type A sorting domain-containing protein n=1 Tax=Catalinimonas locisalis TaxID=3133978 RepID=UPI003100BCA9